LNGGTNYTLTTDEIIRDVPTATYAKNAKEAETANNGAIAYGFINDDGTISKAKGVESVTWNNALERYEIELTDINYYYSDYVAIVTPTGTSFASVTSSGGKLIVKSYDVSGNEIQANFQFVVFDPSK
jgi:hypothetical protein